MTLQYLRDRRAQSVKNAPIVPGGAQRRVRDGRWRGGGLRRQSNFSTAGHTSVGPLVQPTRGLARGWVFGRDHWEDDN